MIAVVLAAGRGLRMGGPKALIPWGPDAVPLAIAHARALREAGALRVAVAVREGSALALQAWADEPWLCLVCSREPDALGAAGSLRAAVTSLGDIQNSLVAITPVDALPVTLPVMRELLSAVRMAAKPVYEGRGGHPVLVRTEQLGVYTNTKDPPSLRELLRSLGDGLVRVPVADPGVTADIDTPEDLARWTSVCSQRRV